MSKAKYILIAFILACITIALFCMRKTNPGSFGDSLSPSTNAEKFGSIENVLNARNENGTRFLVFNKSDYCLGPGLLDSDLEAQSLD